MSPMRARADKGKLRCVIFAMSTELRNMNALVVGVYSAWTVVIAGITRQAKATGYAMSAMGR